MKKERETEEIKNNMFIKIPQYKDTKSGYLWKQSNILKDWKRRYFFIKESQLMYYREGQEILYASLVMSKAVELKDHEHLFAFEIVSISPIKKVVLLAENESECKEWVYVITKSSEQGLLGYSESQTTCADCLSPNPGWCSLNLGVLLCTGCSGIHRSLGSHISKVRSLKLDTIDLVLKQVIFSLHSVHQQIWGEGYRPPRFSSTEEREEYIRSKYHLRTWVKKIDNPMHALIDAVNQMDVTKIFQALISGARINENGILHMAAKTGCISTVALLISAGWEIEAKNSDAFTPLEIALLSNHKDVVEYILKLINS
jgi:Putative GTPase activating protein for Arf/PH domain/Ankyrin repeats (many copies)